MTLVLLLLLVLELLVEYVSFRSFSGFGAIHKHFPEYFVALVVHPQLQLCEKAVLPGAQHLGNRALCVFPLPQGLQHTRAQTNWPSCRPHTEGYPNPWLSSHGALFLRLRETSQAVFDLDQAHVSKLWQHPPWSRVNLLAWKMSPNSAAPPATTSASLVVFCYWQRHHLPELVQTNQQTIRFFCSSKASNLSSFENPGMVVHTDRKWYTEEGTYVLGGCVCVTAVEISALSVSELESKIRRPALKRTWIDSSSQVDYLSLALFTQTVYIHSLSAIMSVTDKDALISRQVRSSGCTLCSALQCS